ncbi:MAG: hypothetical protein A2W52_00695 [Candidatus Taylorbacteria bacterium RIFCSPHIGHO2_02_49_25]|uniref:Ribulose-phosphate 3-epimerase n=1 Tax=Candidatus Taylorbacteria bacterium RIFCSPHIGHO2_02_49_25 TaxID=1802305 RepID=A0A1G2MB79_9BACT|nr:MAG: Ribulose-phosphate 3-epimerase [Parcubacteria group bacterium GW2011_GWF2_50_9]OHA20125.1 MAG: hypothetical protein A2759_03070 [Candidatus Taylorbacteria bacterium RIFCSPHIGHO2_01_FULL_49_60]OHA21147.1 MAG: hypothetical protein A2W52_00695 [Candidatus Taylorbacteria bacterium RIFCSPHIGHO2_02_49_25]OHA36053.1 MAG: hypothetical protein A3B27_01655 [Candidatus Taylorbacteria bacterium RIFCSPLOWO2_01_FULL_50_130]OHA37591.1 MAG: hypothetical protein A2W65_02055 [Candidatus Taylorbacteria ba
MNYHIVPAILPKSFSEIRAKLGLIKGAADAVQIDIVDGKFARNKTWPYVGDRGEFESLLKEKEGFPFWEDFDFEFDLMIAKPAEAVGDFVRIGASRVIVHLESMEPDALSDLIHEWKHAVGIGLALKPSTPISLLETFLHEVSFVQCMGNDKIGFQGITLDEEKVLPKLLKLRAKHPQLTIAVDIGVTFETAPRLIKAGANRLVAGSAIFGHANPAKALRQLKALFPGGESGQTALMGSLKDIG